MVVRNELNRVVQEEDAKNILLDFNYRISSNCKLLFSIEIRKVIK